MGIAVEQTEEAKKMRDIAMLDVGAPDGNMKEDSIPSAENVRDISENVGNTAPAQQAEPSNSENREEKPLSKNAQKRLLKQQLREAQKAERKGFKKQKEKEKKERIAAAKAERRAADQGKTESEGEEQLARIVNGSAPGQSGGPGFIQAGQKRKCEGRETNVDNKKAKTKMRVHEKMTFLIDCGFDDLMTYKEITSLSSQIARCYSNNRNAKHFVTMKVTGLNKRLKHRFDIVLHGHYKNWKGVQFTEEEYEVTNEDRASGNLIYLTSDSDHTLDTLEKGKTYIIGGIVDRNRHKGLCYKKASKQGLKTAKLPIGEYIKMSSRFVLTTNQVIEIMLHWLECRDWKEAFLKVIPQRKQPKAKDEEVKGEQEIAEAEERACGDGEEDTDIKDKVVTDSNSVEPSEATDLHGVGYMIKENPLQIKNIVEDSQTPV